MSPTVVLRSLREAGLPVRGPGVAEGREFRLLTALYKDRGVAAALRRHGIPRRAVVGQVYERFPTPYRLTRRLLEDLYVDLGLATGHIELVTGQPAATISARLREFGIPLRRGHHWSPAMERWRLR